MRSSAGPRVIVTGSEHTGGLAALRALRAAGFEPWAAVTATDAYGALSRAAAGVRLVSDPGLDGRAFAGEVARASSEIAAQVVLPGTEPALLALADHRDLFPPDVVVGAPPGTVSLAATDKRRLPELASAAGLEVPPTRLLTSSEAESRAAELSFPAVVKPHRSELESGGRLRRFDSRRVEGPSELVRELSSLPGGQGLVQPYLHGRLRTVNGVAWEGELVVSVHKVAERTWPLDCGIACYARTVPVHPELERATRALVARIGWSGLFNLQLIESAGSLYAIDLNPRPYHSLSLAVGAGVNLPAIWTSLLLGRRPELGEYRPGVRFRSEEDLQALRRLFSTGSRRQALGGLLPRRRTVHAVFSLRDPKPTLATLRRVRRALGSASRGDGGGAAGAAQRP